MLIATAESDPTLFRFEDCSHIIQAMINAILSGIDGHGLMDVKVFLRKLGQQRARLRVCTHLKKIGSGTTNKLL